MSPYVFPLQVGHTLSSGGSYLFSTSFSCLFSFLTAFNNVTLLLSNFIGLIAAGFVLISVLVDSSFSFNVHPKKISSGFLQIYS